MQRKLVYRGTDCKTRKIYEYLRKNVDVQEAFREALQRAVIERVNKDIPEPLEWDKNSGKIYTHGMYDGVYTSSDFYKMVAEIAENVKEEGFSSLQCPEPASTTEKRVFVRKQAEPADNDAARSLANMKTEYKKARKNGESADTLIRAASDFLYTAVTQQAVFSPESEGPTA